jgi:hypothetical protein
MITLDQAMDQVAAALDELIEHGLRQAERHLRHHLTDEEAESFLEWQSDQYVAWKQEELMKLRRGGMGQT